MRHPMTIAACLAAITVPVLVTGCGGSDSSSPGGDGGEPPITRADWDQVVAQPNGFEGRAAKGITGKVFVLERDAEALALQIYTDDDYGDDNTVVGVLAANANGVQEDDFVRVSGTIGPAFSGENAFGASLTLPTIKADSVEVITPLEAAPAPVATTQVRRSQSQSGVTVSLRKVERLERGGRISLTVRNRSGSEISVYDSNAKFIQGGRQQDAESSFNIELPSLEGDVQSGVTDDAVLLFERMRPGPARLVLEWYSSDYTVTTSPFEFRFTIK
jgi:hypothetical protein